jgi:pre-mRNA-splicing helicase BRR2
VCWQDPDKHKEINGLIGEVDSSKFADVVALGKMMTDFSVDAGAEDAGAGDILDNDIGVAVEFEGDEDDDDDDDVDELVVRHLSLIDADPQTPA